MMSKTKAMTIEQKLTHLGSLLDVKDDRQDQDNSQLVLLPHLEGWNLKDRISFPWESQLC